MPRMYRSVLKPLFFQMDAETAHHLAINALQMASGIPFLPVIAEKLQDTSPVLQQYLWGQTLASPVGLAAGLDKNAVAVPAFSALGFGFIEVGTVTPLAQVGNERPRLFRLPTDQALINRMGFNNAGAVAMHQKLAGLTQRLVPVWVNIGKNKVTSNEEAVQDYLKCVRCLQDMADAFVVNVSSPNTPGLRALQAADDLAALVRAVLDEVESNRVRTLKLPPVLVKLAPDLHPADFEASVEAVMQAGVSGLIISNTTLSREGLNHVNQDQVGGLSGRPLTQRSTELIRQAYQLTAGKVPIVGVGGIFTPEDAYAKIRAGANLVEVYSGLIYEGPSMVQRINTGLAELLARDGVSHVTDVVGVDA